MAVGSNQPLVKTSTRNMPGGKGGRCVRVTTSPPLSAEWEPKPPGNLWATPGLLRDSFIWDISHSMIKNVYVLMWSTRFTCQIRMQSESYWQVFERYWNIKFHDNPSSGSRVVPCRQTDRLDEVRGASRSKECFAIQKYLLIIGKKKNMQVLSHTFTYFST
jgi:hypothetical protein